MTGDCHAGICGSPGVRSPRATRPNEFGDLVSAPGQGSRDPQAAQPGDQGARRAHDRRQDRPNGGSQVSGAAGGAEVSSGLLWLPAGTSAHDALGVCRQRCWKYDWIIDFDVQKFFDTVPWDLVVRAVQAVTDCRWVLLYVKRWLAAPLQHPDGTLVQRDKGTPQGSAMTAPTQSQTSSSTGRFGGF